MSVALAIVPDIGPSVTERVKKGLLSAYQQLLRPLVRILIRHGVSFGEFAEVIKAAYVEVASREFRLPGRKQSDTRIAILTGLTRKEVYRLRKAGEDETPSNLGRVARVVQGWNQDPEFVGPYGVPLELEFDTKIGPSFVELVRRYSGDMSPRAMLDELLRVDAVQEVEGARLRATNRAYIPLQHDPAGLERLGNVVHYRVDTIDHNLQKTKQGAGRFERYVLTLEGIDESDYAQFDALVRQKGQELLEVLDNWLTLREFETSRNPASQEKLKTGVGIFHFIDHEPEAANENNSNDESSW